MIYNLSIQTESIIADNQYNHLRLNQRIIELKEVKKTRTNLQNKSRWLYLEMITEILNERGETFTPTGLKIEVQFTKDNLYHNYWQALRLNMYPNKKGQLNTKEFTDLVEMAKMMFAKLFEISIPFPDIKSKLDK